MYSNYYQAHVVPRHCWFVLATLKSFEHLVFDRTIDTSQSIVEFFVSPAGDQYFLEVMHYFATQGMISQLQKLPNRLVDSDI